MPKKKFQISYFIHNDYITEIIEQNKIERYKFLNKRLKEFDVYNKEDTNNSNNNNNNKNNNNNQLNNNKNNNNNNNNDLKLKNKCSLKKKD